MKKKHRTTKPKATMYKNGSVTLSGLTYSEAKSILTAAWLYNSDSQKKVQRELEIVKNEIASAPTHIDDLKLENAHGNCEWVKHRMWCIEQLDESLKRYTWQPPPKSLKAQLLENKKERELINSILGVS